MGTRLLKTQQQRQRRQTHTSFAKTGTTIIELGEIRKLNKLITTTRLDDDNDHTTITGNHLLAKKEL